MLWLSGDGLDISILTRAVQTVPVNEEAPMAGAEDILYVVGWRSVEV